MDADLPAPDADLDAALVELVVDAALALDVAPVVVVAAVVVEAVVNVILSSEMHACVHDFAEMFSNHAVEHQSYRRNAHVYHEQMKLFCISL